MLHPDALPYRIALDTIANLYKSSEMSDPEYQSDAVETLDWVIGEARRLTGGLPPEEARIRELEAEGMTRSDAQAVYDAEQIKARA